MTIGGWGVGGTPIFSFIFRFGALLLVKNFRKVKLSEYEDLWICGFIYFIFFFWGGGGEGVITKSDFFEGVISIHFRAF